jgi:hypothetical protein
VLPRHPGPTRAEGGFAITTGGTPEPKPLTPVERVLHEYVEVVREFRLIGDAARMHRDRMLTWAIALMGGGLFAAINLRSAGVCPVAGVRALIWAASPWALGVILAVCARIAGEWDRAVSDRFAVLSTGEAYLIRLEVARGLDDLAAERLMQRLGAADLSRAQRWNREKLARLVTDLLYSAALVALVAGMVSVFWRVVTC